MAMDWTGFLQGTANPQFSPGFSDPLYKFLNAAPGHGVSVFSGYRSPEHQKTLWDNAVAKYGSPEAARHWVAPPGHSQHNQGMAADLRFSTPEAQQWAHQHAADFGLNFRMGHEPWHIEPMRNASMGSISGPPPSPLPQGTSMAPSYPSMAGPSQPMPIKPPSLLDAIKTKFAGLKSSGKLGDGFSALAALSSPEPMQLQPMQPNPNQASLADFMKGYGV